MRPHPYTRGVINLIQTLPQRLSARAQETPEATAYLHPDLSGRWQQITWQEVAQKVEALAAQLTLLGLRPGDRVAIMLPTSPLWDYCQLATLSCGGVVVGLDAHDAPSNLQHILALTRPRAIVVPDTEKLEFIQQLWTTADIAIIADEAPQSRAHSLLALLDGAPEGIEPPPPPGPDDTATVVFTSGSTGLPKGIPYSHRQIILACDALTAHFPSVRGEARLVCWLPLSNLFQRILNLFAISTGAQTFFVDKPDQIIRLLPEIKPTLFVGVPRFFEKLHAGIVTEIDRQPRPIRLLVHTAWMVGQRVADARRAGRRPPAWCRALHPLTDRLLARVRALMGPQLMFMASGSAPLPPWLMERFHGLGWLVLEAYGASENVVPIAINTPEAYRFGSVGRPLPGSELRIADDGELLVCGPGVFSGYLGEAASCAVLDSEHFLHTGDFAHIDDDGYLWLRGRKSEVFKTSTGRRITPVPIEAELKKIDYVEHAIIAGRDRPYPVALLTIDRQHPLACQIGDSATLKRIGADAAVACRRFPDYQRPGAIIVSSQPFSILGGELTANLKVRRQPIEYRFAAQIEHAYQKAAERRSAKSPKDPVVIHAP